MKNILCYGDSNTFGWDPDRSVRLDQDARWPGVLRNRLGAGCHVVEEGLPGRTTVWADHSMGLMSGADYLYPCLFSHQPLDLVILMLGTNDTKPMFSATPVDIARGMDQLMRKISSFRTEFMPVPPPMLLIAPARIIEPKDRFAQMFMGADIKSAELGSRYRALAAQYGALFLDASTLVEPSPADGIHLNEASHRILGEAVADLVTDFLGVRQVRK